MSGLKSRALGALSLFAAVIFLGAAPQRTFDPPDVPICYSDKAFKTSTILPSPRVWSSTVSSPEFLPRRRADSLEEPRLPLRPPVTHIRLFP
jgi:hypothetical protein